MSTPERMPPMLLTPSVETAAFVIGALREHARRFKTNGATVPAEVWHLEAALSIGVTRGQAGPTSAGMSRTEQIEVMTPRLVTYDTAAQLLGISLSTLKRQIKAGQFHPISIGGASRIRVDEIDAIAAGSHPGPHEKQGA